MFIEDIMKVCPGCYELRRNNKFVGVKDNNLHRFFYCNNCRKEDGRLDAKIDKVLKGVFIPHYETPVITYIDENIKAKRPPRYE